MIATRQSGARKENTKLKEQRRRPRQTNSQWLAAAVKQGDGAGRVLLLGGNSLTDFRIRIAQSHARQDMLPSFWSHAAILKGKAGEGDWDLYEVSLDPPGGFGIVPKNNGVQEGKLSRYDDSKRFPNIAYIHLSVKPEALRENVTSFADAVEKAVDTFRRQRSVIDASSCLIEWLAFVWGTGGKANPLLKEVGVPSAVFVESVFAIAGLELTPGIASQSSCPEAIWQSAKWWHAFYESGAAISDRAPEGKYCIDQPAAAVIE